MFFQHGICLYCTRKKLLAENGKFEYMQSAKHVLVLYMPTCTLVLSPNMSNTLNLSHIILCLTYASIMLSLVKLCLIGLAISCCCFAFTLRQ
jgi:hypothetical protein